MIEERALAVRELPRCGTLVLIARRSRSVRSRFAFGFDDRRACPIVIVALPIKKGEKIVPGIATAIEATLGSLRHDGLACHIVRAHNDHQCSMRPE